MPENAKHSPRLSFSHDFCHSDSIPIEQSPLRTPLEPSSINFSFSIPGCVVSGESSRSAEEFFSDGKVLPTEIKKIPEKDGTGFYTNPIGDIKPVLEIGLTAMGANPNTVSFQAPSEPCRSRPETNPIRNTVHEIEEIEEDEERPNVKQCWGLKKRSERLNSEIGLPLLSDNPTGSNSKQTETTKLEVSSPSSSSSSLKSSSQMLQRKKKSYGGYTYGCNGGGFKVNSFLDMIPSGSMFGLGSIIVGSGSGKNKKRSMLFHW